MPLTKMDVMGITGVGQRGDRETEAEMEVDNIETGAKESLHNTLLDWKQVESMIKKQATTERVKSNFVTGGDDSDRVGNKEENGN